MTSKKKASIGRQRIPIAKIQKESHRQVTFSKRRAGLFKKASELCTLCGAEIAIIVFSPAKKPFSFGHPNVESILDRYISNNNISFPSQLSSAAMEMPEDANNDLNVRLTQILNQLENEKKKGQAIEEMKKAKRVKNWWESPVEEMNMVELQQLKAALEELMKTVAKQLSHQAAVLPPEPMANTVPFWGFKGQDQMFGYENKVVDPYLHHHHRHINNMDSSGLSNIYNFAYGYGGHGFF